MPSVNSDSRHRDAHMFGLYFWSAKSASRRDLAGPDSSLAKCSSSAYANCLKKPSVDVVPEISVNAGSAVRCETETD